MTDSGLNSVIYSKNVIEFVTVANQYCIFVEKANNQNTRSFLDILHKLLPLVYLKATLLPDIDFQSEDSPEKFVTELDYNLVQQRIIKLLGEYDDYKEVFDDNITLSEGPLTASISENLSDIYQDLKDFVCLYQLGNELSMEQSVRECKSNFCSFWGQKLVNCLRAVHQLVYSDIVFEEKTPIRFKAQEESTLIPEWLNQKFTDRERE